MKKKKRKIESIWEFGRRLVWKEEVVSQARPRRPKLSHLQGIRDSETAPGKSGFSYQAERESENHSI